MAAGFWPGAGAFLSISVVNTREELCAGSAVACAAYERDPI
jgi:hypothetical protein